MLGEAAALGSACLWALSTIVIKGVTGRLSASYIMAVRTATAAVLALTVLLLFSPERAEFDVPVAAAVLLVSTAPLAIAGDLAFVRALAVSDVSRVFTLSTSLYILMSVAGGAVFVGEEVSWLLPFGAMAILAGTRLVLREVAVDTAPLPGGAAVATRQAAAASVLQLSVLAALLWSSGLLILTEALKDADPVFALGLRLPFMALAMIGLAAARGDYARFGFHAQDLRVVGFSGVLALLSMFCFIYAADQSEAGRVAVLTSTSPIFAAPLAWLLLRERVSRRVWAGTLLSMAGIWLSVA
ncbi:MAG TPA: DMT family transporter [Dehalococcoidia bacterium]|nr:DMT family transporter [Dehalococcoidia bacterium]